jgi:hypothetical protein
LLISTIWINCSGTVMGAAEFEEQSTWYRIAVRRTEHLARTPAHAPLLGLYAVS